MAMKSTVILRIWKEAIVTCVPRSDEDGMEHIMLNAVALARAKEEQSLEQVEATELNESGEGEGLIWFHSQAHAHTYFYLYLSHLYMKS